MNKWEILPTSIRQFQHSTKWSVIYSPTSCKWTAIIFYERSKVWPGVGYRVYTNISYFSVNRLLKLGYVTNSGEFEYRNTHGDLYWWFNKGA